jgi:selenocysteine lyase/cysteine desulfurase
VSVERLAVLAPLSCQKDQFSLPAGKHYLNCAYMGPLSRRVQEAGFEGIRRKADPSEIHARHFFEESDELRGQFARLIGDLDPTRVAIIPAVSYGIATVARNTRCRPGQNVVIAGEQFPSNVYSWRSLCRREGMTLRTIRAPDSERRAQEWNAALLDAIDSDTAVVALPQVHWTDGTRFDLVCIGERARRLGAAFVVDASQSLGSYPFDVKKVQPDALVCAGYKHLLGPYSLSLAWFGPRYDEGEPIEENWIGRMASEDFRGLIDYRDEYQPGAIRYDVGERSNFILLPMLVAALEQILEREPARIQEYCAHLMRPVIAEARELGFRVEDEEWRGSHLFGLRTPPGLDLAELNVALQRRNVSASLRGSALRVSPNVYNDEADADALLTVLRAIVIAA